VKELQALLAQAPADTREFFKNELALAIRDIKDEYDYIAKQGRQDMESWYKLKVLGWEKREGRGREYSILIHSYFIYIPNSCYQQCLQVSEVQGNANRTMMESNYQREEVVWATNGDGLVNLFFFLGEKDAR
jgi:hypothetical protein